MQRNPINQLATIVQQRSGVHFVFLVCNVRASIVLYFRRQFAFSPLCVIAGTFFGYRIDLLLLKTSEM